MCGNTEGNKSIQKKTVQQFTSVYNLIISYLQYMAFCASLGNMPNPSPKAKPYPALPVASWQHMNISELIFPNDDTINQKECTVQQHTKTKKIEKP